MWADEFVDTYLLNDEHLAVRMFTDYKHLQQADPSLILIANFNSHHHLSSPLDRPSPIRIPLHQIIRTKNQVETN